MDTAETAVAHDCSTLVFESQGDFQTDASGRRAWSISTWARGDLLAKVEYKAELLGIAVETVNPWGTSRHCPRCGERARCSYQCDRDLVGAVNLGRKYLDQCKMETANTAEYSSAGNHARFPSRADSDSETDGNSENEASARSPGGDRSEASRASEPLAASGVQSATDQQDMASGRQTRLSRYRAGPSSEKTAGQARVDCTEIAVGTRRRDT